MSKKIKKVNPDLLGEVLQLQREHQRAFLDDIKDDEQHVRYVSEYLEAFNDQLQKLDKDNHYARCKLLARWMDDTWQMDTKLTHHEYMSELSKAVEIIRSDSSQMIRDAVLFTYYPELALKEFINWYDEDAERAIAEQSGTKAEKNVLKAKDKLRDANIKATQEKVNHLLGGINDKRH